MDIALGDFEFAAYRLRDASQLFHSVEDTRGLQWVKMLTAKVMWEMGDKDEALQNLAEGMEGAIAYGECSREFRDILEYFQEKLPDGPFSEVIRNEIGRLTPKDLNGRT